MFEELVDIKENNIKQFDYELLNILLKEIDPESYSKVKFF